MATSSKQPRSNGGAQGQYVLCLRERHWSALQNQPRWNVLGWQGLKLLGFVAPPSPSPQFLSSNGKDGTWWVASFANHRSTRDAVGRIHFWTWLILNVATCPAVRVAARETWTVLVDATGSDRPLPKTVRDLLSETPCVLFKPTTRISTSFFVWMEFLSFRRPG